jgi:hypothetical protein
MRNSPDRFSCARDRKPTRAPFSRPFRAFSMGCGAISDPLSLFLSWPPKPDRSVVRNKHEPIRHLILKNNIMLKPGLSRNCRFSLRAPGPARPLPHRWKRGARDLTMCFDGRCVTTTAPDRRPCTPARGLVRRDRLACGAREDREMLVGREASAADRPLTGQFDLGGFTLRGGLRALTCAARPRRKSH